MSAEKNPFLSFCIPTYNNANELRTTVESIIEQIITIDFIEIIISDNCSQDETEKIGKEFALRYTQIKFIRNEVNVGPGRNIFNALKLARGEFLWLLGDDKLIPGAISSVLSAIENCEALPAAIFVNWQSLWPRGYKGKRAAIENATNRKVMKDMEVAGVEAYLKLRLPYLPFMSAHIFNRELLNFDLLERFAESNWIQLYFLFSALSKNPRSLHIARVCVEDNHVSKQHRQVSSDPWPSDIFTTRLITAIQDLETLGFIGKPEADKMLLEIYDYIYCDVVPFAVYFYAVVTAKRASTGYHERIAYRYIASSMDKNQSVIQRSLMRLLLSAQIWPTISRLRSYWRGFRNVTNAIWFSFRAPSSNSKKIVLISVEGHGRVLKIAQALNSEGIKPVLITANPTYIRHGSFEDVLICDGTLHALRLAIENYKGSVFHIICVWNYLLVFWMIILKAGKILIDTFDVLNFFVKPIIKKRHAISIALEKYCLTYADGLICRDLRTNLLKRNNWILPPRILFMDYIRTTPLKVKNRTLGRQIVYLGNIEIDPESSVAYQYGLAEVLCANKIGFDIYPSYISLVDELKKKFESMWPDTYQSKYLLVHETIPAKDIVKTIELSSYGLLISTKLVTFQDIHDTYYPIMERYFFAGKIFDYYESAVFPIVQRGAFVNFVIRRMEFGIVVDSYDDIVKFINANEGRDVRVQYKQTLTLEHNAPRLVKFYKKYL